MKINGTEFDLNYCKLFSAEKLKAIYNGESQDTIKQLIAAVHGKSDEPQAIEVVEEKKKRSKK